MQRKPNSQKNSMSLFNKAILLLISSCIVSCGAKDKRDPDKKHFDKASEYNAYIAAQFDEVNRLWNASLAVMDDSSLIYQQLDSLLEASQNSAQNMDQLSDFKGDTTYKYAAKQYFYYMYNMANGSYREAIEIGLLEDVPDSLHFKYLSISNQIGADKDTCINRLKAAQQRFAENNGAK